MHNSIARVFFAGACLFLTLPAIASNNSVFLHDENKPSAYKSAQDLRYDINSRMAEKARANHFNYAALGPQKTREERAREKREFILCCFAGVFVFACFCFALFPFVKNKFSRAKKKINLRRKQHTGQHTLDDVFAAENKNE